MKTLCANLINTSRKGWIDALRGLAILLVVFGHNVGNLRAYFIFTSPFKMPLFFAISGYVFQVSNEGDRLKKFSNQIFKKVIIPWMILGLLPPIVMIPFKGFGNLLSEFCQILSGEKLWFMPCFIIGETIWFSILQVCKKPQWIILLSFVCFAIGLVLHQYDLMNYAMFNRALAVQPFFLIGYLFKRYEKDLINLRWSIIVVGCICYIGLCFLSMVIYPGQSLDVHLNYYYSIPYCLLLIFLSCFLLFTVFSKADLYSWIMSFVGQNTLVLYIWHGIVIAVLVKAMSFFGWSMPFIWWTALIKMIWSVLVCGICSVLFNRYFPEAIGKKRIKKSNVEN